MSKIDDNGFLTKKEALLKEVRENFVIAQTAYSEQRKLAERDFDFKNGKQWSDEDIASRNATNRPSLVYNKITQFVTIILNMMKQNRPGINVIGKSMSTNKDEVLIMQSIIKGIEEDSLAEIAIDKAYENSTICGEGYLVLRLEYLDNNSFRQKLKIECVDDIFSVYIDPKFNSDYSDISWAFLFKDIKKDTFKKLYPDLDISDISFGYDERYTQYWEKEDTIRVAEYYYIEEKMEKIYLLSSGEVLNEKELKEVGKENVEIVDERKVCKKEVKWILTNGYHILEETTFPGERIPVIPVFGDITEVRGNRYIQGAVRPAIDAQITINYTKNAAMEQIAMSPRAPFIGPVGSFSGLERQWRDANTKPLPFLEYKLVELPGGQGVAPAPQRATFDPQIASLYTATQQADEDLKGVMGLYDPSLGLDSNRDSSGVAILAKQRAGEMSRYSNIDGLKKSLLYMGKILVEIIPEVYDDEREVKIKAKNGDETIKLINSYDYPDSTFLKQGNYDCEVIIGPYGESQKQEAINSMLALFQVNPELINVIGDIFISKQDWDGAQEIADRIRATVPPGLLGKDGELPPEYQAIINNLNVQHEQQLMQMKMAQEQLMKNLATLESQNNELNNKLINKFQEIESKEKIESLKLKTQIELEVLKHDLELKKLDLDKSKLIKELDDLGREGKNPEESLQDELVLNGVNYDPIANKPINNPEETELDDEDVLKSVQARLKDFKNG